MSLFRGFKKKNMHEIDNISIPSKSKAESESANFVDSSNSLKPDHVAPSVTQSLESNNSSSSYESALNTLSSDELGLSESSFNKPRSKEFTSKDNTNDNTNNVNTANNTSNDNYDTSRDNTTKVEDEKASFEIPDFTEEDMNLEIPEEEHLDFEQEKEEEPPTIENLSEKSGKELKDYELPRFNIEGELGKEVLEDLLKKSEDSLTKKEKNRVTTSGTMEISEDKNINLFVEKNTYLAALSREEEVIENIKEMRLKFNDILKLLSGEEKTWSMIVKQVESIKESLLSIDEKMFE